MSSSHHDSRSKAARRTVLAAGVSTAALTADELPGPARFRRRPPRHVPVVTCAPERTGSGANATKTRRTALGRPSWS